MDMEYLEHGIVKYGTPLYVFHMDELKENVKTVRAELSGMAELCFAMKANPFLVKQMAEVTDRIEVCSTGEFEICRRLEISPDKLLISGVLKKKKDLDEMLNHYRGTCAYTVESMNQLQLLADWCNANQEEIPVYLRLTSGNQFGMDEKTIEGIISAGSWCPFLKIRGIHYFSGTQKRSLEMVKKELTYLDGYLKKLEETFSFRVEELEYGPGISVPYFKGQEDRLAEDIRCLGREIGKMRWKGKVILEMGRALTARCGYYLTGVKEIKENDHKNYCIVDGGIHQMNYDGQIRGMYCPNFQVSPEHVSGAIREYTVCGSLCTVNDVLIQKAEIMDLKVGNVLIFAGMGAYAMTEGMALFLSHELPPIVCYDSENGWKLIRRKQETYQWNMEKEIDDGSIDEYFNGN